MNAYISLLRGINVGGHTPIRMAEIKSLYEALGLTNVRTYLQSGNVIFESVQGEADRLAGELEARIRQAFGQPVAVFMRSPKDFQYLINTNPFLHGRQEDPAKLHVTFLQQLPTETLVSQLVLPASESEAYFIQGREVFLFCPNGYGRTRLTNGFFERKLNVPATTRNWKTVEALHQMAQGVPGNQGKIHHR